MDSSGSDGSLNHKLEAVALNDGPAPDNSTGQKETSPVDMLRIRQQMSNQCFEMAVQLHADKSKRSCSTSEADRDLPDYVSELEMVKTLHFNNTLSLHRMQMWHAMGEKLKQSDPEAAALKVVSDRCMALCSRIQHLQQESRNLQDEITELQKTRLGNLYRKKFIAMGLFFDMKRLTREKMRQIEELMLKKDHPDTEKYKAVLEKGQANLEKYKKMAVMTQNVLRGILMACKVNWLDDPTLRDIAMTLEEFSISD
ncbi:centromere protein H isoform X1 [Amphiprion ocellaris]|uniref:Centromere protein H C-terminal domain-containing protein n=1 Tax=Amphiprion ocellaris TaxID=80972 RepID=A0A3Q1BMW0_AMPOC|nr:centromere protein H isoform X1 [Amphiprion ocellaris]